MARLEVLCLDFQLLMFWILKFYVWIFELLMFRNLNFYVYDFMFWNADCITCLCLCFFKLWYIVPDDMVHRTGGRSEMNLPPSVPDTANMANRVPGPRSRTGANRDLGNYGLTT